MAGLDVEFQHKIEHVEPLSVEVERGQRGGYGWKIKIYSRTSYDAMRFIAETDQKLRELFLVKEEEKEDVA
jgi:hypothetical protein